MAQETDIAMMKRDIEELRLSNERQRLELEVMKSQDTQRMRTAIVVLGGLVVSLVVYIWAMFVGDKP